MSHQQRADGDGHDHAQCVHAAQEAAVSLLARREPPPDVRAHLEACPPCREEYLALADLTTLLEGARDARRDEPAPPDPGDDQLLRRLMTHVRRRRRRRWALGLVAVAAAALVAVPAVRTLDGGGGRGPASASSAPSSSALSSSPPSTPPAGPDPVLVAGRARGADGTTQAAVWVRAADAGSSVTVAVRGMPRGSRCRLVVHDSRGRSLDAGVWTADGAETSYTEEIATPPADIRGVELVDGGSGRRIVEVPLPRAGPDPPSTLR